MQGYACKGDGNKAGQYKPMHLSQSDSLHSCKAPFSASLSPSGSGSMKKNQPPIAIAATIVISIPIPKFWTSRPFSCSAAIRQRLHEINNGVFVGFGQSQVPGILPVYVLGDFRSGPPGSCFVTRVIEMNDFL